MTRMKRILVAFAAVAILGTASAAAAADFSCTPTDVTVFNERIHARCSAAAKNASNSATIWFFAVSTSNATRANRFLSTATTALVSGRTLTITYDPADTSGSSFGCQASDCRVPSYYGVY